MPVEVEVDGRSSVVPMSNGTGSLAVRPDAHVVIDPAARILKRSVAVEEYRAWQTKQAPRR
jgi:hypothetical protein